MSELESIKPRDLGVKVSGSAKTGHTITLSRQSAVCQIFGTSDEIQANALLSHCLKALKADEASDEHPGNDERIFMLSVIRDLAPRDAIERMLAVQMAATHVATIRSARWLANTDTIAQVQAHYAGFNKTARTFAAQVEALRRHRTGGEQRVLVQHVNVSDGGKAVVGNINTRGMNADDIAPGRL